MRNPGFRVRCCEIDFVHSITCHCRLRRPEELNGQTWACLKGTPKTLRFLFCLPFSSPSSFHEKNRHAHRFPANLCFMCPQKKKQKTTAPTTCFSFCTGPFPVEFTVSLFSSFLPQSTGKPLLVLPHLRLQLSGLRWARGTQWTQDMPSPSLRVHTVDGQNPFRTTWKP